MEPVLSAFIFSLRGAGVRISPTETLDALEAAALVGFRRRDLLRDALAAALAKSFPEKKIFDTCFDRFFASDGGGEARVDPLLSPETDPEGADAPLSRMLLSGDTAGLGMAMREAAQQTGITGIRFFTQKSLYVQRILRGMGGQGLDRDIQRLSGRAGKATQETVEALRRGKELLLERVRDFVERQYALYATSVQEALLDRYLRDMRLSNLERRDYERMHRIIQRMVKALNDTRSRRKRRARHGLLDVKRTLRENVAHEGVIVEPCWKIRRNDRPEMVVLCDVSRSVEAVSRFMLLFLYSLNEALAKIRSFLFCSNLIEVSHVFETYGVEEALFRLYRGTGLGVDLGRTDYGQAFRDFRDGFLDQIGRKSTVLILGDARNNHGAPETGILRLMHRRARRLIWLNPESPPFWGTGDSEMRRYLPFCTLARECSSLNHLERVVGYLVRSG